MKKIIFLLVFSLTALTATEKAKFTISNSGILDSATSKSQSDLLPTSSAEVQTLSDGSTIFPNSVNLVIDDMFGQNTGWVSNMPSSYGQFKGPVRKDFRNYNYGKMLIWFEVEAAGDGSSCSADKNQAKNTAVEVGWIRSYQLRNNVWKQHIALKNIVINGTGSQYQIAGRWDERRCHPTGGKVPGRNNILRQDDLWDNPDRRKVNYPFSPSIINKNTKNGFVSISPSRFYRLHGWTNSAFIDKKGLQGYYGVIWMRLIKKDPNGIDDRNKANYVGHIACDIRTSDNSYISDLGMSRYKKITNEWQAFNFVSGMTQAQIRDNPPPLYMEP